MDLKGKECQKCVDQRQIYKIRQTNTSISFIPKIDRPYRTENVRKGSLLSSVLSKLSGSCQR